MTLIVAQRTGPAHFMFGDLMLSSESGGDHRVELPARFDTRSPPTNLRMRGLKLKVFCANRQLAIAWAGDLMIARHIILEALKRPLDIFFGESFSKFIWSLGLSEKELNLVSFMFWVIPNLTQPLRYYSVDLNMKIWNDPTNHGVQRIYQGTGEYHFYNLLDTTPHGTVGAISEYSAMFKNVSAIILRASIAVIREITDNDMHDFSYGGGFEIIVIGQNGFEKIPLSQIIWEETSEGIELIGPVFSNHYSCNGILSIRRFVRNGTTWDQTIFHVNNFSNESETSELIPSSDTFTISTVHQFVSKDLTKVVHKMSLNPDLQVHFDGRNFVYQVSDNLRQLLLNWPPNSATALER